MNRIKELLAYPEERKEYLDNLETLISLTETGELASFGIWDYIEAGDTIVLIYDSGDLIIDSNYDLNNRYQFNIETLVEISTNKHSPTELTEQVGITLNKHKEKICSWLKDSS